MSNSALLDKLKGYTRTFVIHSNASPYAGAAAMGAAMGRSQARGAYFHLAGERKPGVLPEADTDGACESAPSNLTVDFRGAWEEFLRPLAGFEAITKAPKFVAGRKKTGAFRLGGPIRNCRLKPAAAR